ncbi:pyridoxamine 5'-phosphate oxidase family protein [Thermomonospora echinospora]|uniref:Pyridoxamine 5'-phosphate oxidase family protein n=1 Tax=Thermomonospora echinospora TaxID=1992 RepID=A0A1H6B6M1_9ACTN|nr:PPOX class F420-dependent oxidoreductase [Thermomonospora echinospora]SEG56260.1 pyridoxamine 5'-phosphate oxidase family protein [Thermomonospora echinospora]
MTFTEAELTYLVEHPLGRLATIGPDGAPQIHPVAFWVNADAGTLDIGGPALTRSQKFRNVQADPRVSFIVDGESDEPNPIGQRGCGIEIRGRVEIVPLDPPLMPVFDNETLRIHPRRIIAWNIDEFGPASPERLPHMQGYNSRNIS